MIEPRALLITGAGGYIGRCLARRWLRQGDRPLVLWLHAADAEQAERQVAALAEELGTSAGVTLAWGDLTAPQPFAQVNLLSIGAIVHCAAVTRFDVDRETAAAVNIGGTEKLLAFARRCPDLASVDLISTIYASGLTGGRIPETVLDQPSAFANHYEWSKWAAERLLVERFGDLPWRIFRLATVIADDESGRIGQENAVHQALKLFFLGLLSLIPGNGRAPLYFLTVDFTARAVATLVTESPLRQVYQVCHAECESATLGDLVALAYDRFRRHEGFRRRGILPPVPCDAAAFRALTEGAAAFSGGLMGRALATLRPFAPQLFVHKSVENARVTRLLGDGRAPDARVLVARVCDDLVLRMVQGAVR
jgi:nucleoside-diphosphate-sugar epimerase